MPPGGGRRGRGLFRSAGEKTKTAGRISRRRRESKRTERRLLSKGSALGRAPLEVLEQGAGNFPQVVTVRVPETADALEGIRRGGGRFGEQEVVLGAAES